MQFAVVLVTLIFLSGCVPNTAETVPDPILQAGRSLAIENAAEEARFYLVKEPHLTILRELKNKDEATGYFMMRSGNELKRMDWFPDEGILIRVGRRDDLDFFEKGLIKAEVIERAAVQTNP